MPFIPTINCVKAAFKNSLFGQDVVNTLWFSFNALGGGEPQTGDMLTLSTFLGEWLEEQWLTAISQDLVNISLTLTRQDSLTAPSIEYSFGEPTGGTAAASMPSSDCLCISFKTAERGRSARGRNYISGIPRISVTGNVVDAGFMTDLEDAYDYLVNNTPAVWNWVVVSHVENGVNRAFGLKQTITDAQFADNLLDVQRRRGAGRGS